MEDILASIRRIIADDKASNMVADAPGGTAMTSAATGPEVAPEHAAEAAPEPVTTPLEDHVAFALRDTSDVDVADVNASTPLPTPEPEAAAPVAPVPPEGDMADVIDLASHPDVVATRLVTDFRQPQPTASPFNLVDNMADSGARTEPADPLASPLTDAAVASSFDALAKSVMLDNKPLIEQLTRDMLRPMLKTWLDDNLPVMVEKLVRAEIERVARGGR